MKAYIRTRLLLGIILSALLVSGLLGIFIYKQSADIFIEINQRVQGEVETNIDLPLEIKNRIMNSAMIASILILFFILVFSFFQVNHILKSLQILSEEIDKLQASDYNYTIQFRKKDELGMIAEVLNQMSIRMKQLKEDTNQVSKVKIITQNLKDEKKNFSQYLSNKIKSELNAILINQTPIDSSQENITTSEYMNFYLRNLLLNVNDILEFYQLESPKIQFDKKEFNLTQLIEIIRRVIFPMALEKKLEFIIDIDKRIPKQIIGDPSRTFLILMNLLNNSIKFTKEGSIHLFLKLNHIENNYVAIDFSIVDTGIGISSDKLNQIFNSNPYLSNGFGLRLSIRILEALGSKIFVESQIGIGSNFSFTLQFEFKKDEINQTESEKKFSPPPLSNIKLLLVEDYKLNQIVVEEFLAIWNVEVDIADNGMRAVEMTKNKDYSIILMDLQMPILDGYEAAKMIRSLPDEKYKSIPIIALTASAINDTMIKVKEAGMNGYITKPFRPEELYQVIVENTSTKL